jgi:hypothetical protein
VVYFIFYFIFFLFCCSQDVAPTTTTTFTPCSDCCEATEIVAPGTGELITISPIKEDEYEWFACPEGFTGQIKMFCMANDISPTPRLFDGYCEPSKFKVLTFYQLETSGEIKKKPIKSSNFNKIAEL